MSPEEVRAIVTASGNFLILGAIATYFFLTAAGKTKLKPIEDDESGEKAKKRRRIFLFLGIGIGVMVIHRTYQSLSIFL